MTAEEKSNVLVVEDDEDVRSVVCQLFEENGFVTRCASTVEQARVAMVERMPDALVLDLTLAGSAGEDLLAELARLDDAPPTLLLSAASNAPDVAARYGIAHVPKPFDVDYLLAAVEVATTQKTRPFPPRGERTQRIRVKR